MQWRILEAMTESEQREILARAARKKYAKNEVLFHEGDPGDSMHLVAKGHLAARATTPLGDVATLRIFRPGDHFGELAVLAPGPRNATVVALEPVETLVLHAAVIGDLRAEHGHVEAFLIEALSDEVRRLAGSLVEALYLPVEKRLWRRLLDLADVYGGDTPVVIPLTQDDLAQLTGTTRPTVNRLLREAETGGTVTLGRGRLEIHDLEAIRSKAR